MWKCGGGGGVGGFRGGGELGGALGGGLGEGGFTFTSPHNVCRLDAMPYTTLY